MTTKEDRARLKSVNKLRIENFGIYIGKANTAKAVRDTKLANLSSREVNDMYTQSWKDGEIAKAKLDYRNKLIELYNKDVEPSLTALESSLLEQHSDFDFEDPRWLATLKTVEMGGKDLSGDTIRQLVKPWAHNQPALEALQPILKRAGIVYDGGIDKMRYNISDTLSQLQRDARDTFLSEDSSIFRFGVAVGKVATFEGVDFPLGNPFPTMAGKPSTVDLGKVTDAARSAAGLPPEGE